jgi:hypothetical protein
MERFNLKMVNDVEVKEPHQVKISNRFASMENSNENVDINRALEGIGQIIKLQPQRV